MEVTNRNHNFDGAGNVAAERAQSASRRDMLKAAVTATVPPITPTPSSTEPYVSVCARWIALDLERERLLVAWSEIEARLARERDWLRLSEQERKAIPEGIALSEIDARLDVLDQEGGQVLAAIPIASMRSLAAVAASLLVAERLLNPEDHPLAHELISRAAQVLLSSSAEK